MLFAEFRRPITGLGQNEKPPFSSLRQLPPATDISRLPVLAQSGRGRIGGGAPRLGFFDPMFGDARFFQKLSLTGPRFHGAQPFRLIDRADRGSTQEQIAEGLMISWKIDAWR